MLAQRNEAKKVHHERQPKAFLGAQPPFLAQKTFGSHRSWTPAPDMGNQRNLKTERKPDKTRSRRALCVADRFVLTFWFFFVKEKEHSKNFMKFKQSLSRLFYSLFNLEPIRVDIAFKR